MVNPDQRPDIFQAITTSLTSFGAVKDGWCTPATRSIDEDGYLHHGAQEDIIITAAARTDPATSKRLKQCRGLTAVMHGDQRPYPVVLITLDDEEIPFRKRTRSGAGHPSSQRTRTRADPAGDRPRQTPNTPVEQVKKFVILDHTLQATAS